MLDLDAAFIRSLGRSFELGACMAIPSFLCGWLAGITAGLSRFPGRLCLIFLCVLPLLLPSFLIAIGLSMLGWGIDGLPAATWASASTGVPLVFLATLASTRTITAGQSDAARLAGGDRLLFRLSLRATAPVAVLTALFGGILTLVDPGPGQIFGWHTAASEMLITHAARYDQVLATRQAGTLAICAALIALPLVWLLAPSLSATLLARDTTPLRPVWRPVASIPLLILAFMTIGFAVAGLLRPLLTHEPALARAWQEVTRTGFDTVLYAGLAAGLSVVVAFAIAALVPQRPFAQRVTVALALAMFALPPVLPVLWLIPWSNRFTVGLVLALRCLPVALLFGLRARGSIPASWNEAARVHRVPRGRFIASVISPWLARWAAPAALLVALLATAEIGVVLLLHPPGHGTFPLAIFTVMANAPEALVATLCLFYVGLAACLSALVAAISRFR